jgi:hypothetical protein
MQDPHDLKGHDINKQTLKAPTNLLSIPDDIRAWTVTTAIDRMQVCVCLSLASTGLLLG